jgi:hypothetical protein
VILAFDAGNDPPPGAVSEEIPLNHRQFAGSGSRLCRKRAVENPNQPLEMAGDSNGASDMESVKRFLSKFAMDVIRATAASAVAALLFTHMQWTQTPASAPTQPTAPTTANPQSTQIVRDEHDLMVEYLKAERAKERAAIEKEIRESKEAAAKEAVAKEAAAKEARDAKLARIAAEAAARQADIDSRKLAPAPKPALAHALPAPLTDGVNAALLASPSPASPAPASPAPASPAPASPPSVATSSAPTPVNVNPNPTGDAVANSLPPLNPPTVIQALPEPPPATRVDAPRDTSLADKAIDATHVKDVGAFMREVGGWFQHEDAPVPPADVHVSRFNNADM